MSMISVGGKNVLYSTTFTIAQGEVAMISAPQLDGVVFELFAEAVAAGQQPRQEIRQEVLHGRTRITFPFMQGIAISFDVERLSILPSGGTLSARVAAHNAGKVQTVHVDVFVASPSL